MIQSTLDKCIAQLKLLHHFWMIEGNKENEMLDLNTEHCVLLVALRNMTSIGTSMDCCAACLMATD